MPMTLKAPYADLDETLRALHASQDGPVRMRVQPHLYVRQRYRGIPGISWLLTMPTVEDAIAVRKALTAFFRALELHGPAAVSEVLGGEAID